MIHVGLSIRIYLLELNYLFEGVNRFHEHYVNTETILHFFIVLLDKCELKKGCTSANFHHYIFSRDRDQGFVSNVSKNVSHDN